MKPEYRTRSSSRDEYARMPRLAQRPPHQKKHRRHPADRTSPRGPSQRSGPSSYPKKGTGSTKLESIQIRQSVLPPSSAPHIPRVFAKNGGNTTGRAAERVGNHYAVEIIKG